MVKSSLMGSTSGVVAQIQIEPKSLHTKTFQATENRADKIENRRDLAKTEQSHSSHTGVSTSIWGEVLSFIKNGNPYQ